MESARDLVTLATELSAGVQNGENNFSCALSFMRTRWIRIDRNTATVVINFASAVGQNCDADAIAEPGHRFVDRVVDDFPNQVVKTGKTR